MSVALPEQLNFEKNMSLSGNCKQQIAIAQPITGSGSYTLGSYFIINIPCCAPDYVFDPMNSFLRFNVYNADKIESTCSFHGTITRVYHLQ